MKKIISLILSVIMLISSVIGANAVFAQENTVKTAISTSVDTVNSCYFAADDCTMWYKFTAPSNNWFTVRVNNPYFSQTDYEYHTFITLHNSDGTAIAFAGTNEFTETCEAHAELKKGNTYYIELDNFADEGESYTVKFSIIRHIHDLKVSTYPAEVDDYAFYTGDYEEHCTICGYEKYYTIPAVKVLKLSATSYVYNGAVRKPSVTVSATNGKAVSKNYYTVTYPKDLKSVGAHYVKVAFKGKYTGSRNLKYTILPQGTALNKLTKPAKKQIKVTWKKQATQTSGYQIQLATNAIFTAGKKTYTVKGNKLTAKTIKKLVSNKKYFVRIRTYKTVRSTNYYSSWSATKNIKTK